jgi:protein-disulfide isomerase
MTSTAIKRSASTPDNRRGLFIIGIIVVLVVVALVVVIALSGSRSAEIDMSSIPQSRADDGGFVLGDPDAPITIVEFADFACPHCQQYHPDITRFIQDFVATGKAKFEYRMFPTAGGATTVYTGKLLECAENQKPGAFWDGYQLMFNYAFSGLYNNDIGRRFATDLGLNYSDLLSCTEGAEQVQIDSNFASQMGVTGTPAVLVRYNDGPGTFVSYGGRTWSSGGPPYSVLAELVNAAQ